MCQGNPRPAPPLRVLFTAKLIYARDTDFPTIIAMPKEIFMNTLDIVFLAILGVMTIRGFFRGLIREIASILGLGLGFFLANEFYVQGREVVVRLLGNTEYASAVSYLAIFFGVILAVFIVATILRKLLKLVLLGWADSLGGGLLGSLKGGLVCSIILVVLTSFLRPATPLLAQSRVAPYIKEFSIAVVSFFPEEIRKEFTRKSKSLDTLWKQDWIKNFKQN